MKAEKTQKEGASRAILTELGSRVYMEDNRPGVVGQAKMIETIQRQPVKTGAGPDNDKDNILVEEIERDEQWDVERGSYRDRETREKVYTNDTLIRLQSGDAVKVKHYMVVKNGTCYQFPVKYFRYPKLDEKTGKYIPDAREQDMKRGGQPEGFGGNQDWTWDDFRRHKMSLFNSRNETLAREYREEARLDNYRVTVHDKDGRRAKTSAPEQARHPLPSSPSDGKGGTAMRDIHLTVEKSKFFKSDWGTGTLSIASTSESLEPGFKPSPKDTEDITSYGMAEMAGTIVIDCKNIREKLGEVRSEKEALKQRITSFINMGRNKYWSDNIGKASSTSASSSSTSSSSTSTPSLSRPIYSPFAQGGGMLARLVEMVAEDIMAQSPGMIASSSPSSSTLSFSSATPTSSSSSSSPSSPSEKEEPEEEIMEKIATTEKDTEEKKLDKAD